MIWSESTFSYREKVNIWLGTWNVGGELNEEEINSFIKTSFADNPDVFVLGIEEMVPLNVSSVLFNTAVSDRRQKWIDSVTGILQKRFDPVIDCAVLYCSPSPASLLRRWWVSPCLSSFPRRVVITSQVFGVSF